MAQLNGTFERLVGEVSLEPSDNEDLAHKLDTLDELASFRNEFCYPTTKEIKQQRNEPYDGEDTAVYLCGNSLGLLPKNAITYVNRELTKWGKVGVLGHDHGDLPWVSCENYPAKLLGPLLGCKDDEVVVMNNLTTNMHLMLSSFYRPTPTRYKLAIEGDAFPSDHYALQNHATLHGFDEKEALVVFKPRQGEDLIRTEDIIARIELEGEKLAVLFFSPVHFRTGQYFDIAPIVEAAHKIGAIVGLDLAHAIGNVPLTLDEWNVDFACACSYKYLNAGAGGIGICYINQRHFNRPYRLVGWFAHKLETRFVMDNVLELDHGAAGFKTGNQSPFTSAPLVASLELFRDAGIHRLRKKSLLLTSYMEWLILKSDIFTDLRDTKMWPKLITPKDPERRGCQLSFRIPDPPGAILIGKELEARGVVVDIRRPDIVRVAPAPLYNSFHDVYRFAVVFHGVLRSHLDK